MVVYPKKKKNTALRKQIKEDTSANWECMQNTAIVLMYCLFRLFPLTFSFFFPLHSLNCPFHLLAAIELSHPNRVGTAGTSNKIFHSQWTCVMPPLRLLTAIGSMFISTCEQFTRSCDLVWIPHRGR